MRIIVTLAGVVLLGASPVMAKSGAFTLRPLTWTFTDKGTTVLESIDAHGNYVARTADGKELDHGHVVQKGGKACFTSTIDTNGETCWTARNLKIGQSMVSVSDKGEKLKVTRVSYVPMKARK